MKKSFSLFFILCSLFFFSQISEQKLDELIQNTIKTFDSSILVAMSVDGLTFENNEIIQTDTYKPIFPNTDNVQIINCNNVLIKGNTYKKIDGKETSITIDEKSTNVNVAKGDAFKKKPSKK